jgi:nicotinamide mononucleotide (NMN) deamidase PncC
MPFVVLGTAGGEAAGATDAVSARWCRTLEADRAVALDGVTGVEEDEEQAVGTVHPVLGVAVLAEGDVVKGPVDDIKVLSGEHQ